MLVTSFYLRIRLENNEYVVLWPGIRCRQELWTLWIKSIALLLQPICSINLVLFLIWFHLVPVRTKWQDSYICIQHSTYRFSVYLRYRTFIYTLSHSGVLVNFLIFLPLIPLRFHSSIFCHHLYFTLLRLLIFSVSVILYVCHFSRNSISFLLYSVIGLIVVVPQTGVTPSHCVAELHRHWRHCHLPHCLIEEFGYVYFLLSVLKDN
jgi:hypothetical protein